MNGTRDETAAACATSARSWASCTEFDESMAQPVDRAAMTSLWSPKIESACVAMARAVTCSTHGSSSPAILYMLGIIRSSPWLAVKLVASAPACSAPWSAPAAPPSLCISATAGTAPQRLARFSDIQASDSSPMVEDGVIG